MSLPFSRSEDSSRFGSVLNRLGERVGESPHGGPAVVTGLGVGHLVVALWNFNGEIQELSVEAGPVLAAALVVVVSLLICLVGYWLWTAVPSASDRWLVAAGSVGGAVVTGAILYMSIVVRLAEGRTVSEPLFVLSLASSQGALAGALVAMLYGRAQREAEAARRRRDQMEFVTSILRHDVLNSMTVVRSRAELLEGATADQQAEFADTIVARSDKVIDLAERVKDVLAVMGPEGRLEPEPVELAPVVTAQVEALRPATDDVTVRVDVDDVDVLADELLAEVVGNLVENALDHGTDEGGAVSVTTELGGDKVWLRVADTGPGVPDEMNPAIFERGTSSSDGGFGLFFVATVVDHYGGDIWVEDRQDGESGAVFVVALQRA